MVAAFSGDADDSDGLLGSASLALATSRMQNSRLRGKNSGWDMRLADVALAMQGSDAVLEMDYKIPVFKGCPICRTQSYKVPGDNWTLDIDFDAADKVWAVSEVRIVPWYERDMANLAG